jgi:hypothetical protein
MNSVKPQRNRGRILSDQGWKKLEDASWKTFKKVVDDFTNEQLKDLTGLDEDTITKILRRERGADQRSINRLFNPFGLQLQEADLTYPTQGSRSHSAIVPQPQEQSQEETPSENPDFVGRQEAIADLNSLVNEGAKVILIQAEDGIGKTTLARKWFERQGLKTLELRVGITSQNIQSAEDWVKLTLRNYFKESPEDNFLTMLEQVKSKLQNERIGVLIDNLEIVISNGKFIKSHQSDYVELLTVLAHVSVKSITFITSSEALHEPVMMLQTVHTYRLDSLNIDAWQHYFVNCRSGSWGQYFVSQDINENFETFTGIHKFYGGNTLAMSLISTHRQQKHSQADLAVYWQHNRDYFLKHPILSELFEKQFNKIKEDNLSAYKLLCRLGFYSNEDILFYSYQDTPFIPKVWLLCLLGDVPKNERQLVIETLCNHSLVKIDDYGYYLHPVIQVEAVRRLKLTQELNIEDLYLIKQQIDELLFSDIKLQEYLAWVRKKSSLVELPFEPHSIRAFYLSIGNRNGLDYYQYSHEVDPNECDDIYCTIDHDCDLLFDDGCDPFLNLDFYLMFAINFNWSPDDFQDSMFDITEEVSKVDTTNPIDVRKYAENATKTVRHISACIDASKLYRALIGAEYYAKGLGINVELVLLIKQIRSLLPEPTQKYEYAKIFKEWFQNNYQLLINKLNKELRNIAIKHCQIGRNWQLTYPQRYLLEQYWEANIFFLKYLNSRCEISERMQDCIKATLFLPVKEILSLATDELTEIDKIVKLIAETAMLHAENLKEEAKVAQLKTELGQFKAEINKRNFQE